jgi:hypothetical protein
MGFIRRPGGAWEQAYFAQNVELISCLLRLFITRQQWPLFAIVADGLMVKLLLVEIPGKAR